MKNLLKILMVISPVFLQCTEGNESLISSSPDYYNMNGYYSGLEGVSYEKYKDYEENPFIKTMDQPVSTFSIDADGGSFTNMRRFMYLGQVPPKASVRIEEYINYFTFDYPQPVSGENVSLHAELATCPWNPEHHLLKLGIKGKDMSEEELAGSNYVFLIDVSGSMASPDKIDILKNGFITMASHLNDDDKVAIVTYAGEAGVLLQSTRGSQKTKIISAIEKLGAGGSTAGSAGIKTAYKIAEENFIEGGNNRIILGSDGDFNVGPSSTEELIEIIEEMRESGIYLTVLGVGGGNLNDYMMEQIANKGNGNYEYIDNGEQIKKIFVNERSKFYTVAKDSKIQITFDEGQVGSYRLIGYENRSLDEEDFDNDIVDAGEIGASQTITALYEVELVNASGLHRIAKFDFRYKLPGHNNSRLINLEIIQSPIAISQASQEMRFAASLTGFGLLMKRSVYKGSLTKEMVLELGNLSYTFDPFGYRSAFIDLVKSWNGTIPVDDQQY